MYFVVCAWGRVMWGDRVWRKLCVVGACEHIKTQVSIVVSILFNIIDQ